MALTKVGKEGITGISNASDATFLTATSAEGVTLAGTLAVTGVHTVGTNAVATSEGGAATSIISQGLAKQWAFLQSSGTSVTDSFNNTSTTDNGTGDYTLTIANNMSNDDFAVAVCSGSHATSHNVAEDTAARSTTVYDIRGANAAENAVQDIPNTNGMIMGDLA